MFRAFLQALIVAVSPTAVDGEEERLSGDGARPIGEGARLVIWLAGAHDVESVAIAQP